MANDTQKPVNAPSLKSGPYLAKIVSHLDPNNMGTLEVQILREVGNDPDSTGQIVQVKYMTPFYGVTSLDFNGKKDDYNNTQKSYGMWMIPPDVGTIVVVIFIEGDPRRGYWIGCVPDDKMNFMMPGYAATSLISDGTKSNDNKGVSRLPVAEYNKKAQSNFNDGNMFNKPAHFFQDVLFNQGLVLDDVRGITTSSARREAPSSVFGISTPGPIDKRPGAKTGTIGPEGHKVTSAFVSRLGGSSFVMDDGDDKFLRNKSPSEGPPSYSAVEYGQSGGDVTRPHNELIRLRTRTGHQILMHNSEDLIYIGNARGTTWIELTSDGKIDIFANDSVSVHSKNDLNVTADRKINLYAKKGMNITSEDEIKMYSKKGIQITAENDILIGSNTNINVKAKQKVNVNGQVATPFPPKDSKIPGRIPLKEPWARHENLDPVAFKKGDKYDVVPLGTDPNDPKKDPPAFAKYTALQDTFKKMSKK
jgi:hypothetical protein